jgi:hypothetical protein
MSAGELVPEMKQLRENGTGRFYTLRPRSANKSKSRPPYLGAAGMTAEIGVAIVLERKYTIRDISCGMCCLHESFGWF